jgi:flagellar hook-associated protein 3 FlgL
VRVVPSEMYSELLSNLQADRQSVNQDVVEASSGKSVNNLSDNPLAAGQLVISNAQLADVDEFSYSVSTVQGSLNTADSALNSVVSSLTQAVSVGTEAAGGTLSTSELQALGQQVDQIQQQVIGLANTTYQGNYVFAGTAVNTQPYNSTGSPIGVYAGNSNTNSVEVGEGQTASMGLSGSAIFNSGAPSVPGQPDSTFQYLSQLSSDIKSNNQSGIATDITNVQSALNNVIAQRSSYGDTLQQLNSDSTNLSQEKLTLQQYQTTLIGADEAQVATNLSQSETTLQAAIAAAGQVSQESLINYLK